MNKILEFLINPLKRRNNLHEKKGPRMEALEEQSFEIKRLVRYLHVVLFFRHAQISQRLWRVQTGYRHCRYRH